MYISIYVRIVIVAMGIFLAYSVFRNLVQKKILETQGLIWVLAALLLIIIGIFPKFVLSFAVALGIEYGPSLFFIILDFVFLIVVFFCTKWISQLTKRVHELAMQVSLLNQENERIMKRLSEMTGLHKTEL